MRRVEAGASRLTRRERQRLDRDLLQLKQAVYRVVNVLGTDDALAQAAGPCGAKVRKLKSKS